MLGPYYWPERLSMTAQEFVQGHPDLAVSDLVEVELFSALGRRVRRGDISLESARRVTALFLTHLEDGRFGRLPIERAAFLTARAWLSGLQHSLQTLDALHLAVAAGHGLAVATADAGMARAAAALGMKLHQLGA